MNFLPTTKYKVNERTVSGTVDVENSDVLLNVDTSVVACVINLKSIPTDFWSTMYILYIKDLSGNCATNNITIIAPVGFKINNQQSIVLNVNSVCVTIKIASNTDYNTSYNTQTITGGHIIADEGTLLPQQPILNFVGELVSATDGTGETIVTINNNLRVQNTVYVMKNGSDSTGLVERFDKPFLTIVAAVDALRVMFPDNIRTPLNRYKVVVEDGSYNESTIFLYPYIDFDFGNSVITACISDDFTSTVTYSANSNKDFTTKIFGNARLIKGSTFVITVWVTNPSSRILIQCDTISSNADDAVGTTGGYLRILCNQIYNDSFGNVNGHAIEMQQYITVGGIFPKSTVDIVGAKIYVLNNTVASTINFGNLGTTLTPNLNQTLNLYNCTVVNDLGNANNNETFSAITCGTTHSIQQGSTLNLYNSVIYSKYGKSVFVSSAKPEAHLTVYYYNLNSTNIDSFVVTDANHTLTEYLKTNGLTIDANVLPIIP
jgi:hypothetical protein